MRGLPDRAGQLGAALAAAGFALTLYVFWPGVMTFDARYVYEDIAKGFYGDWQSPAMTWLWSKIDPIAPGPGSILLLTVSAYWLAIGLLARAIARRSLALATLLFLLALSPPVFVFLGIIWRDVLFMAAWLLAAALVFAAAESGGKVRVPAQAVALALLAFGVLLRPNAIPAAPLLAAYLLWPSGISLKRAAILYIPLALGLYGLVHLVYYEMLDAKRQHPLHSIMVFDLGGISHYAKDNVFPGSWSADEAKLITDGCYLPERWDAYWTMQPCKFVMERLEGEKIFGTPALTEAWTRALLRHPLAYAQHRARFMGAFLAEPGLTMWVIDLNDTAKIAFADNPRLMALKNLHDALKPTPLFLPGTWLALAIGVCLLAWRRRATAAGAYALGVCASAIVYVISFAAVGVATDFRYALWLVAAALMGAIAAGAAFIGKETETLPRLP